MKKLSKKRRAELLNEFAQYTEAISFSECQIRKLMGENLLAHAREEEKRLTKLQEKQKEIGALL